MLSNTFCTLQKNVITKKVSLLFFVHQNFHSPKTITSVTTFTTVISVTTVTTIIEKYQMLFFFSSKRKFSTSLLQPKDRPTDPSTD